METQNEVTTEAEQLKGEKEKRRAASTPPPLLVMPRLVNVPTAARLLCISVAFLRDLIRRGKMPSVRMGRRLLVRTRDIDAVIDAGGVVLS